MRPTSLRLILFLSLIPLCAFLAIPAASQTDDLLGKYAAAKDGCADPAYEIRRGVLDGPDGLCIMGNPRPGANGLEELDSRCKRQGETVTGALLMDLSRKPGEIALKLPGAEDWTTLFRCE